SASFIILSQENVDQTPFPMEADLPSAPTLSDAVALPLPNAAPARAPLVNKQPPRGFVKASAVVPKATLEKDEADFLVQETVRDVAKRKKMEENQSIRNLPSLTKRVKVEGSEEEKKKKQSENLDSIRVLMKQVRQRLRIAEE
ncbi:hypothetical protein PFISCL1PPCAC_19799, partial [Pristionchus fissidentatus]